MYLGWDKTRGGSPLPRLGFSLAIVIHDRCLAGFLYHCSSLPTAELLKFAFLWTVFEDDLSKEVRQTVILILLNEHMGREQCLNEPICFITIMYILQLFSFSYE